MSGTREEHRRQEEPGDLRAAPTPPPLRVLLVGPSLRILGGQAVMADQLVSRMRRDGLDVEFLPINPKPPGPLALAERVTGLRTLVVSCFYVARLLARVRHADVVHLFSASYLSFLISQMPAILVARLYRKPLLLNYRSGEARDHLSKATALPFALLRLCTQIVVPSGYLVDVFGRFGFDAVAIPNTIDPEQFRHRVRTECAPKIVVPRTLEPLYNVGCALRALAHVQRECPNASMTVLGEGSQEAELRALASQLGLANLHFAGRVARDDMGRIFDQHDLLVNTSSIDNMPVSLLEGFAAGLPIVTTNAGGIPAFVRDRDNAHMVEVDDDQAVARRILEIVGDPAEAERLSRTGLEETRNYVWPTVARRWYALYADVATRTPWAGTAAEGSHPEETRAAGVARRLRRILRAPAAEWRFRARQKSHELALRARWWMRGADREGGVASALASFGCSGPGELARRWRERSHEALLDDAHREALRRRAARDPKAFSALRECAATVIDGRFPLFSLGDVAVGPEAGGWCVEPIAGRRAPHRFYADVAALDPQIVGDHKLLWEASRFAAGVWLGAAHVLRGEEENAPESAPEWQRFRALLGSWLDENPYPIGAHYQSALEVAFRAYAWLWAAVLFRDRLAEDPELLARLLGGIRTSCLHIERNLSHYFSPNTHLTGEAFALFACGAALPEFGESQRWRETGERILTDQAPLQFHEDGMHRELSSSYHLYSCDFYLQATVIARRSGFGISPVVEDTARRACNRLAELSPASGPLPAWNDCDGGRLLSFGEGALDPRPTLEAARRAFPSEPLLREARDARDGELDPGYSAWLVSGAEDDDRPIESPPSGASRPTDSGIAVYRSDPGDHLVFRATPFGLNECPHSHDAALALSVTLRGAPVIVDGGTGTYTAEPEARDHFRSARARNALTFDGLGLARPDGPFAWRRFADAELLECECSERGFSARGRAPADPGSPAAQGLAHTERSIDFDPIEGKLEIRDRWHSNLGGARAEIRFLLAPGTEFDLDAGRARVPGLGSLAFTVDADGAPVSLSVESVPYSPDYASIETTGALVVDLGTRSSGDCTTLFRIDEAPPTGSGDA